MPFTPAHAVVALPLLRTPLVPAGIAIGAMTPDLPLFFRFGPDYWLTHDWLGALVVDLPLAFGLLLVWRLILRPAAAELTPRWFASRLPSGWGSGASGWWSLWAGRGASATARLGAAALLAASLSIGIATHLVWDAFTHEHRWGSVLVPQLGDRLGPFLLWDWAHYTSSALGLAVIAVWGIRWLRRRTPAVLETVAPRWLRIGTWLALPGCLAVAALAITLVRGGPDSSGLRVFVERAGTLGGALYLVVLALVSVGIALVRVQRARQ